MNDNIAKTDKPMHMLLYILLIVFFAYFYTAITFNPDEVADDMKKYGGFIPWHPTRQANRRLPFVRALAHHGGRLHTWPSSRLRQCSRSWPWV